MQWQKGVGHISAVVHTSRRRLVVRVVFWLVFLLICAALLAFCVGPPSYYRGKYGEAGDAHPAATPAALIPEEQTEPHTCGLHALSSIYKAYALDPGALDLRFRLGTDKPLTNFDSESTGTLPPDIRRVLKQDNFQLVELDLRDSDAVTGLFDHLRSGHPALALTHKGSLTTGLHWVALEWGSDASTVRVCDSLKPEKYEEGRDSLTQRVNQVMLISPAAGHAGRP
jgi:hypothetical protein